MKKVSIITTLTILNLTAFASLSDFDGLSSCRFTSKFEARNFIKALDGSIVAAARLSKADLAQVESCSTAMTMAIKEGHNINSIIDNVDTSKKDFGNGIETTVFLRGVDEYAVNGKTFMGTKSTIDGDFDMIVSIDGKKNEISQGIPTDIGSNTFKIQILSDKQVRVTSAESNLDATIPAIITRDEKGGIKYFSIHAEELEEALKPILNEHGVSLAKGLNMNTEDASFKMDYQVSAMDCRADNKGIFKCSSAFIFKMSVQF